MIDESINNGEVTFINSNTLGNGTILSRRAGNNYVWIAEWEAGTEFYSGTSQKPVEKRMLFTAGGSSGQESGSLNLTETGKIVFLNSVSYMLGVANKAKIYYPTNNAQDIEFNPILSWIPGISTDTHNVFFSSDFNDVKDATISDPLGATVSIGQPLDANTFDPGSLEFGKKYYWRVDEVNDSSEAYKGQVWSFTVEREALDLPFANFEKVTAISSAAKSDANDTVNGYGLGVDANFPDQHSNGIGSWVSSGNDDPNNVWIQYDFDKQYKIHQMLVWNYNQNLLTSKGFNEVLVQYSEDGNTWIDMPEITKFEKAPGKAYYDVHDSNNVFDFNDVIVKSVRITALSNYGTSKAYGLSEVRFTYIPVRARIPSPADGTENVAFGTTFKWRNGREALSHKFYIGTDKDAVTNGTVTAVSLNTNSYSPNLSLGNTYYWRVDELNTNMDPSVWQGNVWSFTTPSTILVEGFENGYGNDTAANAVFLTWKDSGELGNSSENGSYMGRRSEPFLDTINHSGGHSAPMEYDNTSVSYSEVVAETSKLQNGSNWSLGNPGALVIWFMSDANDVNEPALDRLYVKIDSTKKVYNGTASIRRAVWTKWEIPLAGISLGNVATMTIGVERINSATGSTGTIYLDDIMLTQVSPLPPAPVNPGTDGLLAKYSMENNVQDSSGNGLNGTLTGLANGGLAYVDGMAGFGKALVFDGNDDCVDLGKPDAFNFEGSFSISLWAKASAWSTGWGNVMISNRGETTGGGWQIRRYTNNNICFTTRGVSNDDTNTEFNLALNEWDNITCVYDSEAHTKSIYINGVLDRTVSLTGEVTKVTATTTKTYIGARSNSGNTGLDTGTFFKGALDQIIIYNRALSAGEAAYLAAPTN